MQLFGGLEYGSVHLASMWEAKGSIPKAVEDKK